jgi:hypothetical protein
MSESGGEIISVRRGDFIGIRTHEPTRPRRNPLPRPAARRACLRATAGHDASGSRFAWRTGVDGFYIGINGGGSAHTCWDVVSDVFGDTPGAEGWHNATGGTVGGQIGYRWQTGSWVWGIEGQGNWADFSGSGASLLFPGFVNNAKIDPFGLITGQVGYAWNNALFYVKGGTSVTSDGQ